MSDITPIIPATLIEKEETKTKSRICDYIHLSNEYVNIIADILEEIVNESAALVNGNTDYSELLDYFISKKPPQISIKQYLNRLMKYCKPEPSTIVISLIYIDKCCEMTNVQLTNLNIHRYIFFNYFRFILTSLLLAIKYNEDDYYANKFYAKVGGISLEELNQLESNFLLLLNYNTFINDKTFQEYIEQLKDCSFNIN